MKIRYFGYRKDNGQREEIDPSDYGYDLGGYEPPEGIARAILGIYPAAGEFSKVRIEYNREFYCDVTEEGALTFAIENC